MGFLGLFDIAKALHLSKNRYECTRSDDSVSVLIAEAARLVERKKASRKIINNSLTTASASSSFGGSRKRGNEINLHLASYGFILFVK